MLWNEKQHPRRGRCIRIDWHRYYDPETGRYLTPDPIGLAGGINPFVYATGNPINRIDPYGLMDITWGQIGTGTLGVILTAIPEPNTTAIGIAIIGGVLMTIPGDSSINNPPALEMAKGGKQNIDNEYVRYVQNRGIKDPCNHLRQLCEDTCDKMERRKIKQAMKRYNCDGKNRYK